MTHDSSTAAPMVASVHVVDVPRRGALRAATRRPRIGDVPGMRWAEQALVAPLAAKGPPPLRRAALFTFWDDEAAIDRFVAEHPVGQRYAGGLHLRLRPLRAHGAWPGLPADVPSTRAVPHQGPVAVLTLGRLRLSQTRRFLRTSRPAEESAVQDEAMIWGAAAARPPFVATISIWRDSQAVAAYAYGKQRPQHRHTIEEKERKDFHRQSAFIRFAPIRVEGELGGANPVTADAVKGLLRPTGA